MSFEELESFIEAQRQLHDQLMTKHTVLKDAIVKQKQQLQAVQQQMLLNLQAQLTIDPSTNHQVFEEQFRKAKQVSEMQEKHETKQRELVKTLKETRRKVERHNRQQLKRYREKRSKNRSSHSLAPSQVGSLSSTSDQRTTIRTNIQRLRSPPLPQPKVTGQIGSLSVNQQNQERVLPAVDQSRSLGADSQGFGAQALNPQQEHLTRLSKSPQIEFQVPSSFPTQPNEQQSPGTLSNIQNLLTASSQNPQAMQKLLSGLSSQPDVARTLLNLLKQAQSSESSEAESLLFSQNLQQTTDQFSAALNTGIANRTTSNHMLYPSNVGNLQETQQQRHQNLQQQQRQQQQQQFQQQQQQQRMSNLRAANQKMTFTSRRQMRQITESSTATWTSTETQGRSIEQRGIDDMTALNDNQRLVSTSNQFQNSNNEKQKETSRQKDYFSNFTSKELEAMFLSTPQQKQPRPSTSGEPSTSSCNVDDAKLREEEAFSTPLLVNQQQLMQMHEVRVQTFLHSINCLL